MVGLFFLTKSLEIIINICYNITIRKGKVLNLMEKQDVLSLVKKLLSMAESKANENEAKVAAMKAQQLIAKYNIVVSDIDEVDNEIDTVDVEVVAGKKRKINLSVLVANNFRCKCFWVGK